jgi:hypothetical protein
LVALAVCQAAIGISSDRQFLGLVGRVLPGWFPHLPDQSQYNRRLRGLVGLISVVQQRLARWLDAGGVRLADGTQLAVAGYAGCQQKSHFAGFACYGYARSQHRFVWGVRLVLLTDERGLPLGYTIVPANEKEYEPLADLLTGTPAAVVIADKTSGVAATANGSPATASACSPKQDTPCANQGRERALASTRLVIESVFANLKGQMPRTPPRQDTRRTVAESAAHSRTSESSSTPQRRLARPRRPDVAESSASSTALLVR